MVEQPHINVARDAHQLPVDARQLHRRGHELGQLRGRDVFIQGQEKIALGRRVFGVGGDQVVVHSARVMLCGQVSVQLRVDQPCADVHAVASLGLEIRDEGIEVIVHRPTHKGDVELTVSSPPWPGVIHLGLLSYSITRTV